MSQVQLNADGIVIVRTTAFYADTVANFQRDFGLQLPVLPNGVVAFFFDDVTIRLYGIDFTGTQVGLSLDLIPQLRAIISNSQAGTLAKAARIAPSLSQQVDILKNNRLLTRGFIDPVTGKVFQTDDVSRGFLTGVGAAAAIAKVAGDTTTVFSIIASDNTVWSGNANDTDALIRGRIMPWVSQTVFYARQLKDEIAAGNPPADITVGWP